MSLSSLCANRKIQWEKEQVVEKIVHTKEQYKRFIPQRRGLGYVETSPEKFVQPSVRYPRIPKTTPSKGTQAAYIDHKIT